MNCPSCGAAIGSQKDGCLACGAAVAPPTEGALAPDLAEIPAARKKPERALEPPAFRKKEPAWKDEIRERLKHRRRPTASPPAELPLFPEPTVVHEGPPQPHRKDLSEPEPAFAVEPARSRPELEPAAMEHRMEHRRVGIEPAGPADLPLDAGRHEMRGGDPTGLEVVDFRLRPAELLSTAPVEEPVAPPSGPRVLDLVDRGLEVAGSRWSTSEVDEPSPEEPAAEPVERPAQLLERVQAASLDAMALGAAAAVVVYFAARAARVPLLGLLPAWPYLGGFLAVFGLVYASFFTGLTGQTLGKMLFRLRVVDRDGAPPGHARAALRALVGSLGSLALVGIAPILVDPARRALHDRLLKTRVIHI